MVYSIKAFYSIIVLLKKGAVIDKLNADNQNCLDVAISRNHREVIRVLLNDPNWSQLIKLSNYEMCNEDDDESNLANEKTISPKNKPEVKYIESKALINQTYGYYRI